MIPRAERSRYRAHVRRSAAPLKLPSVLRGLIGRGRNCSQKLARYFSFLPALLFGRCAPQLYSVLSHEAIIDSAWDTNIKPLLLKRFPDATVDELREAHGYAYGGAIIQDMGYYPHGSMFFSDLSPLRPQRRFRRRLAARLQDLNEYAFAIGAMAHYAADTDGHRLGTNRAVPILYPKLRKKHGDSVTYEDDPLAHVKTEFGFDVLEVAKEPLRARQLSRFHWFSSRSSAAGAGFP